MELEDQVCSLELAKKLDELGASQKSYFQWKVGGQLSGASHSETIVPSKRPPEFGAANEAWSFYSAFTVAELGEMLEGTEYAVIRQNGGSFFFKQMDGSTLTYGMLGGHGWGPLVTEADGRAKMLVYLIENNLLERVA